MTRLLFASVLCTLSVSAAGADDNRDTLFQVSTIDALLAGVYQPLARLDAVLDHGDFGLGTFAGLDGELILLDGRVYRAAADGRVEQMPSTAATPFIALTWFDEDQRLTVEPGQDYATFKGWLADRFPSKNINYAVRVDGRFAHIRYRSVPAQQPPYRPLRDVAAEQRLFNREEISGTLIGFWCPSYVKGLNVPGFHLHFLSEDRRSGGHVLDFQISAGEVVLDPTNHWELELPTDDAFLQADLNADRTQALHQVETGKQHQESGKAQD